MSNPQDDIELIERFFRQELNEDELLAFENRVRQDPNFSKEVIEMRNIFYGVRLAARKDFKEELREIQNEVLSQPLKPYKPNSFKWLKWFAGIVLSAAIIGVLYTFIDQHDIERFKSKFIEKDSVSIESVTPAPPAGLEPQVFIKSPSDTSYATLQADIELNVKDASTFSIKKIGVTESGLYKYEVKADGKSQEVISLNPNLAEELMKRKDESINDSVGKVKKPAIKSERNPRDEPDKIDGVDY